MARSDRILGKFFTHDIFYLGKRFIFLLRTSGLKAATNYLWASIFDSLATPDLGYVGRGLYRLYKLCEFYKLKFFPYMAPYPEAIEVEVTTRCNLRCIMCEHTYWNEKKRDMTFEEFKKIVDQFPRLKHIGVTGIGSSFLNKDYMKMLQYLKSKSISVELFDTFFLINENIARELVKMKIDRIWFSIDAATKETYEKIRVGSSFERVTENFRRIVRLKRELKSLFPEFVIHYIVFKTNLHEVPEFIDLVQTFGLEKNEAIIQFTPIMYGYEEVKDLVVHIPQEIIRITNAKAKELGFEVLWNQNVQQSKPPISQCRSWRAPYIQADGHVQPCCAINEANQRAFIKAHALGNVLKEPFWKIWNTTYRPFIETISKGQIPTLCRGCPFFDTSKQLNKNACSSTFGIN